MPKFTVVHGSLKVSSIHSAQVGETVELTAEEAKHYGAAVAPEGAQPLKKSTVVLTKKPVEAPAKTKESAK